MVNSWPGPMGAGVRLGTDCALVRYRASCPPMSDQDEPKANERSDGDEGKRREPAHKAVASNGAPGSKVGMFVVVALLAGAAAGYFGHMLQAKAAAAKADSAAVGSGGGPCDAWEKKICSSTG